jgi:catechol 2,3-dioxygenase-like lactoylglutathione lyase family enzyme
MIPGLRTAIYPAPDLQRAKAWYSELLGQSPYFDQPFYVGFSVGGFELGLVPEATPSTSGPQPLWGVQKAESAYVRLVNWVQLRSNRSPKSAKESRSPR